MTPEDGLGPLATALVAAGRVAVLVTVREARGSTPRDAGTCMIVAGDEIFGTIGGGRLEWAAIEKAQGLLASGERNAIMSLPLGPALDQCCGGHVILALARLDKALAASLTREEEAARAGWPVVLLFGAGHVGIALAEALRPLPLGFRWYDERPDAPSPARRDAPLDAIEQAPSGAAIVVMTHDHKLDYGIAEAALLRPDFAYVGMIGSSTKKARFCRGFIANGHDPAALARLVCPIGAGPVKDKRPAVIAAMTAAELLSVLLTQAPLD
ncbi:xanthine dehydrogenase accessory protein XdhC [Zavarzinia aquatilis]|uniref:Xanthine dehydrogenase accessory protein XdhC n=1 Tax=Zavarzinia aquatilis TaxID=2211142 RepID=A0A317E5A7_9PROT|nr:xanthine dehydrogenase accessory protein XdhC [Zavarzinia aquatilis]PWR21356.1 xanthine dehydrogenase accessory protein XdhC [Zavarzinia aquatilis]